MHDIRDYYYEASSDKIAHCMTEYFMPAEAIQTQHDGVWTGTMAKGIHKLRMRSSGGDQLIPDAIHDKAWNTTHSYAVGKYGDHYAEMPGYSRYSGVVKVYRPKSQADSLYQGGQT